MAAGFEGFRRIDQHEHGGLRGPFQILEADLAHERDFAGDSSVYIMDMYNSAIYPNDVEAKGISVCTGETSAFTVTLS